MSIEIIQPGVGGRIGPGIRIQVTVDVPYPIPVDHQWDIWVAPIGEENNWRYRDTKRWDQPLADWHFMVTGDVQQPLQGADEELLDGQEMRLVVNRREGGLVVETLSQQIYLDMRSGIAYYQQVWDLTHGAQGGLTAEQAVQLEETHEATIVKMAAPGIDIQWPIDVLSPHPALDFLKLQPAPLALTGDGQIFLPGQPGLIAFGAWWECSVVPPEVGLVRGLTERFQVRILQLNVLHSVDGIDLVTEVLDADFQRVLWEWQKPLPFALAYSVTPGFEVLFHLLTTRV